jgi:hypothetical protein
VISETSRVLRSHQFLEELLHDHFPPQTSTWGSGAFAAVVRAMRSHGNGGTLLVAEQGWGEALRPDGGLTFAPPFSGIASMLTLLADRRNENAFTQTSYEQACEVVGRMTAIDGAVVIDPSLRVHRAGAVIDFNGERQEIAPVQSSTGRCPSATYATPVGGMLRGARQQSMRRSRRVRCRGEDLSAGGGRCFA